MQTAIHLSVSFPFTISSSLFPSNLHPSLHFHNPSSQDLWIWPQQCLPWWQWVLHSLWHGKGIQDLDNTAEQVQPVAACTETTLKVDVVLYSEKKIFLVNLLVAVVHLFWLVALGEQQICEPMEKHTSFCSLIGLDVVVVALDWFSKNTLLKLISFTTLFMD